MERRVVGRERRDGAAGASRLVVWRRWRAALGRGTGPRGKGGRNGTQRSNERTRGGAVVWSGGVLRRSRREEMDEKMELRRGKEP